MKPSAVTFDYGQTLAEIDTDLLSARVKERGGEASPSALSAAIPHAFKAYNEAILAGVSRHPWKLFMNELLLHANVEDSIRSAITDFLWDQQPVKNLWRRPIVGMIDLVHELKREGIPVAIISNAEGRAVELLDEMGWGGVFEVVADSGRLGLEKPGREIFDWTAARLGVAAAETVHIGDSFAADVQGALNVGARAIWYQGNPNSVTDNRVRVCLDAAQTRLALSEWGLFKSRAPSVL